ncbi:MAG: hypothetical protein AAGF23_11505 [Acidobacteriota bacterium]
MVPRQTLARVPVTGGGELELSRRGDDYLIQIDRHDLMSSRCHGSEEAMARLALEATGRRGTVRWLVGGLGMGFTLRACLDALDGCADGSRVVVAEVFDAVVSWNREILGELAARPLDDPRTEVVVGDVYDLLAPGGEAFDAILLDVDNGPEAMTLASNDRLYRRHGLDRLRQKLAPGGVLAVWSAFRAPRFEGRLRKAGFGVESHSVRARLHKGERHTIVLATPRGAPAGAGRPRRRRRPPTRDRRSAGG